MFRLLLDFAASEHCWVAWPGLTQGTGFFGRFLSGVVLPKESAVMTSAAPRGFLPLLAGVSASQQQLLST